MALIENQEKKIVWTNHAKRKLKQYHFSEKRALRIFRHPDRIEEGIVEGTIAAMQIIGTKRHPSEAWLMYTIIKPKNKKSNIIRIISVWRYPGRTPFGQRPLIPYDTLEELGLV